MITAISLVNFCHHRKNFFFSLLGGELVRSALLANFKYAGYYY